MLIKLSKKNKNWLFFILFSIFYFLFTTSGVKAAILSLSPSSGTFETRSVFEVSLFLDTEGQIINAVDISLAFPPDKIQLVSPSVGQSIIGIWTAPTKYDNQSGKITLTGLIPGGINASKGLVTKLSFRVKSVGTVAIRFLDDSKVLLHDGKGTNVLNNTVNGVYNLVLPPPQGPIVSSSSHPDASVWYNSPNVILNWVPEEGTAEGYSYVFSKEASDIPDDIVDSNKNSIIYSNVADGINYFHIKTLRAGQWGGVTHFIVKIDTTPPAGFPIEILPSKTTTRKQPIVQFSTTDENSGIDYYELKIVPLQTENTIYTSGQTLFVEAESPYILSGLDLGTYDIIVRAYDKAGNWREEVGHLKIVSPIFEIIGDQGVKVKGSVIPWLYFWIFGALIVLLLVFFAWRIRNWHRDIHMKKNQKELPEYVREQLEELKKYRQKYGSKILILLFFISVLYLLFSGKVVSAQSQNLEPPIITTLSKNISNEEIFYIGGKTTSPQTQIILYLQNLQTGETTNYNFVSDSKGDWFYRHDRFLPSGQYILWAQSKIENELSPPTPQFQISVYPVALQFGVSRLSYTTIYLALIIILLFIVMGLIWYTIYHIFQGRRKKALFMKEIREAEESVRRGFAILRRDIQAELAIIQKAKMDQDILEEERQREEHLLRDLAEIERYIGKEVFDIEKYLNQ